MAGHERDKTDDWLLPEAAKPPLLSDLVARIDEAIAIARSSEAAVMTVGAAALDAAEQARRAAGLAERASGAMLAGRPVLGAVPPPQETVAAMPGRLDDGGLSDFTARADRIAARLRQLERAPLTAVG